MSCTDKKKCGDCSGCNSVPINTPNTFSNDPSICPENANKCETVYDADCVCWTGDDICELDISTGDSLVSIIEKLLITVRDNSCLTGGGVGPAGPTGLKGDKGDTGFQGNQGLQGDIGATGPIGATGITGAIGSTGLQGVQGIQGVAGLNASILENFYAEAPDRPLSFPVGTSFYNFPDAVYETLTYQNTAETAKTYIVNVSYQLDGTDIDEASTGCNMNGAIIKTDVSSVDTILWESKNEIDITTSLMDVLGNEVNSIGGSEVVNTLNGNSIRGIFKTYKLKKDISMFKKVTLLPNESVSLKFLVTGKGDVLRKAQFFINELTQ